MSADSLTRSCTGMGVMSSRTRADPPLARLTAVRRLALAAAVVAAFAAPGLARAELIPGTAGAQDSLLAIRSDGTPLVAYVAADNTVVLATRSAAGTWTAQPVAMPKLSAPPALVGLAQTATGTALLTEATNGSRLVLAEQRNGVWTTRVVANAPVAGALGFGGLATDLAGRPVIAYASLVSSRKTALKLVRENAAGKLSTEAVTKLGFPPSSDLPTVAPVVLPTGKVRVVEAYSGSTIEWYRAKNGKWMGQFIFTNGLAQPAGVARAVPNPAGDAWSAWTELYPSAGESHVILAQNTNADHTTILDTHAFLVGLANTSAGPEVAADDYVDLLGARTVYAGVILSPTGTPVELDGNLEGYGVEQAGGRQYLLLDPSGVSWYRSPTAPTARVSLSAAVDGASFVLTGTVTGAAAGGSVEIDRETGQGQQLLTTVPLAADGTFTLTDLPPSRPLTYRAVYRDANGVPLASLVRTILGA